MNGLDPEVDGWQIDAAAHRITKGADTRRLEPTAMQVLVLLAAEPGVVVSRAELLRSVWGGAFVGDDAVSAAIIKLRRAFNDSARSPRVIETVHKSGYRLIAPITTSKPVHRPHTDEPANPGSPPSVRLATLLRCEFDIDHPPRSPMAPEQWRQATEAIGDAIARIILRHGGTPIHESTATMGVFGAPVSQEHHALRAVQAAIEIRTDIHATSGGEVPFTWRIALASGEVLSTSEQPTVGPSIYGAPVQRVSSLGSVALPSEILLAGETRELAMGLQDVHLEQRANVGSDCYTLGARAGWSSPWEARAERGLTPMFGRDHEVGRIEDLLRDVSIGKGRIVAVSGEPGAGKSRLVHEALLLATAQGLDTMVAAASPLEARTPFFPIRELLVDRLQLGHPLATDDDEFRSQLERHQNSSSIDAAALLAVLRPERPSHDWTLLDPEIRRTRTLAAILDVMIDDERPSLIVFEDLHWADEATLRLVDVIVTHIARRPCIAMVTYRPEFMDPWPTKSYYTHLPVDVLASSASGLMIDHLVGHDPSVERWKATVIGRAGGTPLFIEEVVRSARATGALTGEAGDLKLSEPSSQNRLPASVLALVADRVDRLSEGAREILWCAAVIGREVPAPLLASLVDGLLTDRTEGLEELQASELLFSARYQRQPGFVFKHALTQEVAYRQIPESQRREFHRTVADALRSSVASGAHVSPEMLARHHSGAEQHALAIDAWVNAASSATRAAAFSDALDHLDRAREALTHVTAADRGPLELAIELAAASTVVQSAGPTDPAVEHSYRRARVLASALGTARQRYEGAWGLWFVHLMRGEIGLARLIGDELLQLAIELDDEALQLEAHHVQWSGLSLAGEPRSVRVHAEIGITQYQPEKHHWLTFSYGGHDPGVCSRNLDAMALWLLGQPDLARERSASALSLATDLGHPYTKLESFNSALNIALLDGDVDTLQRHAAALQMMVDDGALPVVAASYANGFSANALVLAGDLDAGVRLMRLAAPVWQEFWGAWCFPLDSAFAMALALAGHPSEAIDVIEGRLTLVEESGAHWWDSEFHRVLGELVWASAPAGPARAIASLQRALSEARRQEARFLELRAATSLARLYHRLERTNDAVEILNAICGWFPPDAELTDLRSARELRATLMRQ
jgi:DNA-binding winged helix-turn-helix (wHTH) protein/predicted ATPase